jgi:nicotinate phosphoribosyltransferase
VPALDCAYKLQEYDGVARRKQSTGKATWPGRKQVWRRFDAEGSMAGDVISLEDDDQEGTPFVEPVMKDGARLRPSPALDEIRDRAATGLAQLQEPLRRLERGADYPVSIARRLEELAEAVDRRVSPQGRSDT